MKILKYIPAYAFFAIVLTVGGVCAEDSKWEISASEITAAESYTEPVPVITAAADDTGIQSAADTKYNAVPSETTAGTQTDTEEESENSGGSDEEPCRNGWTKDDEGRTYYYGDNGEKYTGLSQIDDNTYYFASNGVMKTGWYTINDIRMFFAPDTGIRNTGWIRYMNASYYDDAEQGKLTGIHDIDDKTYIFDEYGRLCSGWIEYEGRKYYGGENGAIIKGMAQIDDIYYLFSSKGGYLSGWQTINGIRTFYDYDSCQPLYEWINYNGYIYYSDSKTGKYTGDKVINGDKYRFSEKGCLLTGFQEFDDGIRFYRSDGTSAKGIEKIDGNTYYFDNTSAIMRTGFQKIDGQTYYFGADGKMQTGFQKIDGQTYCFGTDGKMQIGLAEISGKTYHFNDKGVMSKGWKTIENTKYYFSDTGEAYTGWQIIDKKKYYFSSNGVMKTGWQDIDGKKYCFDFNGVMLTNQRKDNYLIGADGSAVELKYPKAADVLDQIGWDLQKAFQWSADMPYYTYTAEASLGIDYYANYGFNNAKGNCYVMAAVFCEMAKTLGYDAQQISGSVPLLAGGYGPHSWVEIVEKGNVYVFDPDFTHETGRNGFRISYGMPGTWIYVKKEIMKD